MRSVLKHDPQWYTPAALKNLPEKEVRKEYSRLAAIMNKRLKRIGATEFAQTETYRQYHNYFKSARGVNTETLIYKLSAAARLAENEEVGSLTRMKKQRAKSIETLHENGINFVNESNFFDFADFMEQARLMNLDKLYDSGDDIAQLFAESKKLGIDKDAIFNDFDNWLKNVNTLKKMRKVSAKTIKKNGGSAAQYYKTKLQKSGKWAVGEKKRNGGKK